MKRMKLCKKCKQPSEKLRDGMCAECYVKPEICKLCLGTGIDQRDGTDCSCGIEPTCLSPKILDEPPTPEQAIVASCGCDDFDLCECCAECGKSECPCGDEICEECNLDIDDCKCAFCRYCGQLAQTCAGRCGREDDDEDREEENCANCGEYDDFCSGCDYCMCSCECNREG